MAVSASRAISAVAELLVYKTDYTRTQTNTAEYTISRRSALINNDRQYKSEVARFTLFGFEIWRAARCRCSQLIVERQRSDYSLIELFTGVMTGT